jgi:hypothetical protein
VFLCLQMLALLAKIVWMNAIGVSAGPALVIIPLLLLGALASATLALRRYQGCPWPVSTGSGPAVDPRPGPA